MDFLTIFMLYFQYKIDKPVNYVFEFQATATDGGNPAKSSEIPVTIEVKESNNKAPQFVDGPGVEISVKEGTGTVNTKKPIASYKATSNIPDDDTVFFQVKKILSIFKRSSLYDVYIILIEQKKRMLGKCFFF